MKPLKKAIALVVLSLCIFAFTSKENTNNQTQLDVTNINVLEILSKQSYECRPSLDYQFYVETDVNEQLRGATSVSTKVYIMEKKSGKTGLLTNETVIVPKFQGSLLLEENSSNSKLKNGDQIVNKSTSKYSLKNLSEFETIYNSYIKSTNNLLEINRSI